MVHKAIRIYEHNRRPSNFKECGGSNICGHGKRKSDCRECGDTSSVCERGKRKSDCKECGGASTVYDNTVNANAIAKIVLVKVQSKRNYIEPEEGESGEIY